jgi:hypothetical protein
VAARAGEGAAVKKYRGLFVPILMLGCMVALVRGRCDEALTIALVVILYQTLHDDEASGSA